MESTRIALITGATSGLGRAVARALAEWGMHVLVHGRDSERVQDRVPLGVRLAGSRSTPW
jgi:NADP-dependent 3-hydroxy acid dehydrogenase YdfG